ncbi:MAG: heavy-metal-associated domain-containing protein [Selenomonadaceae bacterium]|nr:heavy-metal-associated domain-containing protein [Selenomonadaceae bacterium]MBR1858528.1 heavy-metal-associated domain-containing protein [Selenomonadaceae bacterium]
MIATIILGICIAALFGYGIYNIYCNFFKGEATCCKSEGGCSGCPMKKAHENYRTRVEAIEKFNLKKTIDVDGMTCEHCVNNVIKALEHVDGVAIAAASLEKQSAEVALERETSDEALKEAIKKAGYKPGNVLAFN